MEKKIIKLGDFLKFMKISQDDFAHVIGMKSRTSLTKYKEFSNFSSIRSSHKKSIIKFLFDVESFDVDQNAIIIETFKNIMEDEKEKEKFRSKFEFLLKQYSLNEQYKELSVEYRSKVEISKSLFNTYAIKHQEIEEFMALIDLFKLLIDDIDSIRSLVYYIGKMNGKIEFEKYYDGVDEDKQRIIEAMIFTALNEKAKQEIPKEIVERIFEMYENRVEVRKEILRENM